MTSIHPTLPEQTLVPGVVDPTKPYGDTIYTAVGPVVQMQREMSVSRPMPTMSLGDTRHKELLDGLKQIAQRVDQKVNVKTVEALEETREWRK